MERVNIYGGYAIEKGTNINERRFKLLPRKVAMSEEDAIEKYKKECFLNDNYEIKVKISENILVSEILKEIKFDDFVSLLKQRLSE